MELIYKSPEALKDIPTGYCPGCFHGLTQKLIAEVVDELGIRERAVFGGSVGCNGMGAGYVNFDSYGSNHGRAAAAASAFKRCSPDSVVIVYQGDGDGAAIGMGETVNAAFRGEAITVIFANNGLYGMTGGQLAPTTLNGARTKTTVNGYEGFPLHLPEMIATLKAPDYVARCAVHTPKYIMQFKKALKHALTRQIEGGAYSMIEVLCACPTSGGFKSEDAPRHMEEVVMKEFPLGEFKRDGEKV